MASPAQVTTIGRMMFDDIVPEQFRADMPAGTPIGSKEIASILQRVAEKEPDSYRRISSELLKFGGKASVETEVSFGLEDLKSPVDKQKILADVEQQERTIFSRKDLNPKQRQDELVKLYFKLSNETPDTIFKESLAKGSNLAKMVASGARGNKQQLSSNIGADWLIIDSEGNPVPVPLKNNYAEGLNPGEYYGASFGTRQGLVATKFCQSVDTEVLMADWTARKIQDIKEGDWVIGASVKDGRTYPVQVTRVFDNGLRECVEYKYRVLSSRSEFVTNTCTPDHKILAKIRAWTSRKHLSSKEPEMIPSGENTAQGEFIAIPQAGGNYSGISEDKALLLGLMTGDLGKKSHDKFIPDCVDQWDNHSVSELLKGLYTSDGCCYQRVSKEGSVGLSISYASTSEKLVRKIKFLLEKRFGVYASTVYRQDHTMKTRVHATHDLFSITISHRLSIVRFYCSIGMIGRKGQILEKFLLEANPLSDCNSDITFKRVSAIPVGLRPTYDLEVDSKDHTYVLANSLVVSNSTADAGYASKQLATAAQDLIVTENDCGTNRGIPVEANDFDSVGGVLARPVAGIDADTVLDKTSLKDIASSGAKRIVVRSPITCQSSSGICSQCAGMREKGGFPSIGENIGLSASSSVGEPLAQSQLSSKHSAGVANAKGAARVSGFNAINALFQSPKVFPDGSTVAAADGAVTKIENAPQGGKFLYIGEEKHYVPTERTLNVKVGQTVEAGDALTDGVSNPADVVRFKGVGEGRRYFLNQMRSTLSDSGITANRRNLEVISRAVVNHVQVDNDDGYGDWLPDDTVRYADFEKNYVPSESTTKLSPKKATGMYLQRPALHYTIGTRITPNVAKDLDELGETEVDVSPDKPPFAPKMQRLMANSEANPDWMAQLGSSYIKGNLLDNIHRGGASSDIHGTNPLPGMAAGVEFGKSPAGAGAY